MTWDEHFAGDVDAHSRKSRTVTVGWTIWPQKSQVIWSAPQPYAPPQGKAASAKSVQFCPAAVDFDRRHFVIPCPVDLTMKFERLPNGQGSIVDADGLQSGVRGGSLRELFHVHPQEEWRAPDRPLIQMHAPYVFIADEPCYIVQSPPYLHYMPAPRPGVQIGGRYPIHIWPRPLSWGFEWYDISKPLVLKRGEPWFYIHFETENPAARVRLVEQERTAEFEDYVKSIADVTNYVNRSFSLFSEAQSRRPASLVRAKKG